MHISLHQALAFKRAESDVHFEIKAGLERGMRIWQVDWPGWGVTSWCHPPRKNNYISKAYYHAEVAYYGASKWEWIKQFDPSPNLVPVWRICFPGVGVFFKVGSNWFRRLLWSDLSCRIRFHSQPLRIRKDAFSEFMIRTRQTKYINQAEPIISTFREHV